MDDREVLSVDRDLVRGVDASARVRQYAQDDGDGDWLSCLFRQSP